jgi:phenylalanine-4-hydroxylase
MSPRDLKAYGIYEDKLMTLEFESGIVVKGIPITGTRDVRGKVLIISLDQCTVTYHEEILFQSDWGIYDMAIGKEVVSAFAGSADPASFLELGKVSEIKTHKIFYSEQEQLLNGLYEKVKKMREEKTTTEKNITKIFNQLKNEFQSDWLLNLELYELALQNNYSIKDTILEKLIELKQSNKYMKLIENGLVLCKNK